MDNSLNRDNNLNRRLAGCKKALLAGIVIFVSGSAPLYANDLKEELAYVINNHPSLEEARNVWRNRNHQVKQAYASFLPKVDVRTDIGPEKIDNPSRRLRNGSASSLVRKRGAIDVSYNLFDGFGKEANLAKSKISQKSQALVYDDVLQLILAESLKTYIQVQALSIRKGYSESELAVILDEVEQQRDFVEQGGALRIDLLQAQSRETLARDRLQSDIDSYERMVATYERLFNRKPNIDRMTPLSIPLIGTPVSLEEALVTAANKNPALNYTKQAEEETEKNIDIAKAGFYPNLNIVATADWEKNVNAVRGNADTQSILLQGTWNLFDGYATSSREKIALYEKYAARDRRSIQLDRLENDIKDAWVRYETALARMELMNESLSLNESILASQIEQVDAGRVTSLTLVDQQTILFALRKEVTLIEVSALNASVDLLVATGTLKPDIFNLDGISPTKDIEFMDSTTPYN